MPWFSNHIFPPKVILSRHQFRAIVKLSLAAVVYWHVTVPNTLMQETCFEGYTYAPEDFLESCLFLLIVAWGYFVRNFELWSVKKKLQGNIKYLSIGHFSMWYEILAKTESLGCLVPMFIMLNRVTDSILPYISKFWICFKQARMPLNCPDLVILRFLSFFFLYSWRVVNMSTETEGPQPVKVLLE